MENIKMEKKFGIYYIRDHIQIYIFIQKTIGKKWRQ
ncbi:unnamed protein product [Paramecium sonneborni]|uniref:Uncharacterized protein n=1 Tax=Paramecium sonneborni TaxID=65129 RepID=A0A8S1Q4V2_9CILI|nr:unnamed protein product [Paramecium sonneborni]